MKKTSNSQENDNVSSDFFIRVFSVCDQSWVRSAIPSHYKMFESKSLMKHVIGVTVCNAQSIIIEWRVSIFDRYWQNSHRFQHFLNLICFKATYEHQINESNIKNKSQLALNWTSNNVKR